ncbi:MAG: hypothetical protein WDM78_08805 [Puia sp.]
MKKNLKLSKALKEFTKDPILIDENMPDYSNAPFVLRKLEIAEKFIAERGLPESIIKPKAQSVKPKTETSRKLKA